MRVSKLVRSVTSANHQKMSLNLFVQHSCSPYHHSLFTLFPGPRIPTITMNSRIIKMGAQHFVSVKDDVAWRRILCTSIVRSSSPISYSFTKLSRWKPKNQTVVPKEHDQESGQGVPACRSASQECPLATTSAKSPSSKMTFLSRKRQ